MKYSAWDRQFESEIIGFCHVRLHKRRNEIQKEQQTTKIDLPFATIWLCSFVERSTQKYWKMRKQSENAFIDTLSFVSCLAKNARRNGAGENPIVAGPIFGSRLETTPTALGAIGKISSLAKKNSWRKNSYDDRRSLKRWSVVCLITKPENVGGSS